MFFLIFSLFLKLVLLLLIRDHQANLSLVTARKGIILLQPELRLKTPRSIMFSEISPILHPSLYLCPWQCDFGVPPISTCLSLKFGLVLWLSLANRTQKYYLSTLSGLESFCLLSWKLGLPLWEQVQTSGLEDERHVVQGSSSTRMTAILPWSIFVHLPDDHRHMTEAN